MNKVTEQLYSEWNKYLNSNSEGVTSIKQMDSCSKPARFNTNAMDMLDKAFGVECAGNEQVQYHLVDGDLIRLGVDCGKKADYCHHYLFTIPRANIQKALPITKERTAIPVEQFGSHMLSLVSNMHNLANKRMVYSAHKDNKIGIGEFSQFYVKNGKMVYIGSHNGNYFVFEV